MSTHNICFHPAIRKNIDIFWVEKRALSGAMHFMLVLIASAILSSAL